MDAFLTLTTVIILVVAAGLLLAGWINQVNRTGRTGRTGRIDQAPQAERRFTETAPQIAPEAPPELHEELEEPEEPPLAPEELVDAKSLLAAHFGTAHTSAQITATVKDISVCLQPDAQEELDKLGISKARLESELKDSTIRDFGDGTKQYVTANFWVYTRGITHDGKVVLSCIQARDDLDKPSTQLPKRIRKAAKSKPINTFTRRALPSNRRELVGLLESEGFVVYSGAKHDQIRHEDYPGKRCGLSSTPSDRNWVPQLLGEIRRTFGVDLRYDPPIKTEPMRDQKAS